MNEKEWVCSIQARLSKCADVFSKKGSTVLIKAHYRLPYAHEILRYNPDGELVTNTNKYETDLLILDQYPDGTWNPRVVIEFKLGSITTHDALTYSTKASTHKQVHPYLRYGIIIGGMGDSSLPPRLVRHGSNFDFMQILKGVRPSASAWKKLVELVQQEITTSRKLQPLMFDRSRNKRQYTLLHRPLKLQ